MITNLQSKARTPSHLPVSYRTYSAATIHSVDHQYLQKMPTRTNSFVSPEARRYISNSNTTKSGETSYDAGKWTAKSNRLAATYHHPSPRPRQYLGEAMNVNQRIPPSYQADSVCKPSRSYRDTTSEIISLYGPGHPSLPLSDTCIRQDENKRSLSLSTTVSRDTCSTRKSPATLRFMSGGVNADLSTPSHLYPSRLRRPRGNRAASPSNIDIVPYSDMCQSDHDTIQVIHMTAIQLFD